MKTLFWAILLAVSVQAHAADPFIDTDSDGVADWEDYCPNTPAEAKVWTVEGVSKNKGNPRWVGCSEGEAAKPGFVPPTQKEVLARRGVVPPTEDELLAKRVAIEQEMQTTNLNRLRRNLNDSFERMAKATVRPKAILFRKAAERIRMLADGNFSATDVLCGNKLVVDLMLPVVERTTSKTFEKAIEKMRELSQLLTQSTGNRCEGYERSPWTLVTQLSLMSAGWSALGVVGFPEKDLGKVSDIKVKLGVATASVGTAEFSVALRDYLDIEEREKSIVEAFFENELCLGVSLMMGTLRETLKGAL